MCCIFLACFCKKHPGINFLCLLLRLIANMIHFTDILPTNNFFMFLTETQIGNLKTCFLVHVSGRNSTQHWQCNYTKTHPSACHCLFRQSPATICDHLDLLHHLEASCALSLITMSWFPMDTMHWDYPGWLVLQWADSSRQAVSWKTLQKWSK